ncbi:MAG: hypothetical protein ACR2K2_08240 [Mycobacteriales bacterium]
MSLSRRSRRAAAVGVGALALVLLGGPASAAGPALPLDNPISQLTEPLQPVLDAVAPVAAPVVEVLAPQAAPRPVPTEVPTPAPALLAPVTKAPAPARPAPAVTAPAPADLVKTIVDAVFNLVELAGQPAAPPATKPVAPAPAAAKPVAAAAAAGTPVTGQGGNPAPVDGPARPAAQAPVSAASASGTSVLTDSLIAGILTGDSAAGDSTGGAAMLGTLGAFARDLAGADRAAALEPVAGAVAGSAPSLALPGLLPQVTRVEEFLPANRLGSGSPASLPALLVAMAATAVAVSAAGHATEVRRRRQVLDAG